jgi:DNA-directed RNA polymerase specialized sigma24 family protein
MRAQRIHPITTGILSCSELWLGLSVRGLTVEKKRDVPPRVCRYIQLWTDTELVEAVIRRDEAALDIFHERYEPTVRNSLYRKFGEVNEDYRQEAWLNIFDNLSKFNEWRGSLASFVWSYSWWGVGRLRADKSIPAYESLTFEEDGERSETDREGWLEWQEQDFCDAVPTKVDFDRMLARKKNDRERVIYLLVKIYGISIAQVANHFKVSNETVQRVVGAVGHRSTGHLP